MSVSERDRDILKHIVLYCDDIEAATRRFGNEYGVFETDKEYRNACALCILQIGELCGHLSETFRNAHKEMPWNQIKGMRNIVAHRYGSISVRATWETIESDIPSLREFCKRVLAEM